MSLLDTITVNTIDIIIKTTIIIDINIFDEVLNPRILVVNDKKPGTKIDINKIINNIIHINEYFILILFFLNNKTIKTFIKIEKIL